MKKTVISAGVISVMMMSMGSALAAGMSPELKVTGQMAVPSCEVSLDNEGVFDLGKIASSMIKPTQTSPLTTKVGIVTVDCGAETYLNFNVVDNREGTASTVNSTYFGLGNVNGTGKLGYYSIMLAGGSVDGIASNVFSAPKGSTSFTATTSVAVDKNKVSGWATSHSVQNSGKRFTGNLQLTPVLASSASMGGPITEGVTLDGSATLNFVYGI